MTTKMHPTISGGASFSLASQSPSFTSYSSENIADIAARVVKELNLSQNDPFDDDYYSSVTFNDAFHHNTPLNDTVQPQNDNNNNDDNDNDDDDDDEEDEEEESEFEFAILTGEENSSPISADEIFDNGQIKPMFPVFNTDLVYGDNSCGFSTKTPPPTTIRVPLRKLLEERETSGNGAASCSSSEADDLEGVPPGTYCVWTPKKKEEVLMMKKKSKSTGSSKRWRFRDLLHRSNSDGKDTFVFLTPSNNHKSIGVGVAPSSAIDFLTLCHRLKTTKRKGWINHRIKGPESIADHMYRMALMGLIAGDIPGVNRERCIKMAVVHDIAEAIVGDITPSDGIPKEEKSRMEQAALNEMCEVLGGGMRADEIKELWTEYENNSSLEANLVKDFDKVEMILQALEYETEHGMVLDEFFLSTAGKFQTELGKSWAAEVISRRKSTLASKGK